MRFATLIAAAILATTAIPAMAEHHAGTDMAAVLASDIRANDRARDQYRHPAETLAFFQIAPDMKVVEYGPGGGWYTRVLAPYLAHSGSYMAMNPDSSGTDLTNRARAARSLGWTETFPATVKAMGDFGVTAFESDEIPEGVAGTVDRVVIFRSLHGMLNGNTADRELRAIRSLLADDGMVGVEQHRAPEDASYDDSKGTRGYLRQSDVIRLFELNGFALVGASEINANPADPADWPRGVWTLPPTFGDDSIDRERLLAIGESDRMTLLFRKR